MTIKQILEKEIMKLRENNIIDPSIKARIMLAYIINKTKEYLVINEDKELNADEKEKFEEAVSRIIQGEPLQHITGKQEFMKMDFIVNKNVLIPRPDTEILVEEVIEILKNIKKPKILDLCTGSGVIAISIAKYVENAKILAADVSEIAIEIAKQNAEQNIIEHKIKFIQTNLFDSIQEKFNLIVSNPPYIEKETINELDIEVQKEPILALDGGVDGLDFYRKIILEADKYLESKGYLCLEIGYNQREKVIDLIKNSGKYYNIYSKQDLAGNDRIIICQKEK